MAKLRGFIEYQARYGMIREYSKNFNEIRKMAVEILKKGYDPGLVRATDQRNIVYIFEIGEHYAVSRGDVVLKNGKGYWIQADTIRNPGPHRPMLIRKDGSVGTTTKGSKSNQMGLDFHLY